MTIKGEIDEVRFCNEENGYTIVILDVDGEPVTAAGTLPPVNPGQTLMLSGEFVLHKKYGRQFSIERAEVVEPAGADGIIRYLGSGIIKGIGPTLALRIYNAFGPDTFEVIEHQPHRLSAIKGITAKKALEIGERYNSVKEMQDAVMTLQEFQMSVNLAVRIYKCYGKDTTAIVKTNPYRLIEDVDGVGFATADRIAQNAGIPENSEFRIGAGIIYALSESARSAGNTCLYADETVSAAARLLNADEALVKENVQRLLLTRKLKSIEMDGREFYALSGIYLTEKSAAVALLKLIRSSGGKRTDCAPLIKQFEKTNGIDLHEKQREAVEMAINEGVTVITGGPGTGKTTIIKCILDVLDHLDQKVVLMAPTGRAAKRMENATGREASTVHRALGLQRGGRDMSSSPLYADAVIIDEMSMVDIFLFESILKRLSAGTKMILVGDRDQLPSVGAGNVLSDLLNSGCVSVAALDYIYRQSEESLITLNAHAINRGEMPDLSKKSGDFFFVKADSLTKIAELTTDLTARRLPAFLGLPPDRVQVLSPVKKGDAGTIALNKRLQAVLNPQQTAGIETESYTFFAGDKVMQTLNDYDQTWRVASGYTYREGQGVFNGDMGRIKSVDAKSGTLTVLFEDDREAEYDKLSLKNLILAYAVTVHKSQGCEFDAVVLPLMPGSPMMLTRNLLYTAVTRAKSLVAIVGDAYTVKKMVQNDYIAARFSMLKYFLCEVVGDLETLYS